MRPRPLTRDEYIDSVRDGRRNGERVKDVTARPALRRQAWKVGQPVRQFLLRYLAYTPDGNWRRR